MHKGAIQSILSGHDPWVDNPSSIMREYIQFYKLKYAAFPTSTVATEQGVKELGRCHVPLRSEMRKAQYVTSRALFVHKSHGVAKSIRTIAGKKLVTKHRKNLNRGEGKYYSQALLSVVHDNYNRIRGLGTSNRNNFQKSLCGNSMT